MNKKIKEKYPNYEVMILKWEDNILSIYLNGKYHSHTIAQSMIGFNGYVYDCDGVFESGNMPSADCHKKIWQPVAVLFKKT